MATRETTPTKGRFFTEFALEPKREVTLAERTSHHVCVTLRAKAGEYISVFNGKDGEWLAEIQQAHKKHAHVQLITQLRPQTYAPDIMLCFAPVKNEKIDFMLKRATELGVRTIQPILTDHTQVKRMNTERLEANIIEAAQQCGRTDIPTLLPPLAFSALLMHWEPKRTLLHADEYGEGISLKTLLPTLSVGPYAVIIGPEGGFSQSERMQLHAANYVTSFHMGPRILRAETAVLATLATLQPWVGDWEQPPRFQP